MGLIPEASEITNLVPYFSNDSRGKERNRVAEGEDERHPNKISLYSFLSKPIFRDLLIK